MIMNMDLILVCIQVAIKCQLEVENIICECNACLAKVVDHIFGSFQS